MRDESVGLSRTPPTISMSRIATAPPVNANERVHPPRRRKWAQASALLGPRRAMGNSERRTQNAEQRIDRALFVLHSALSVLHCSQSTCATSLRKYASSSPGALGPKAATGIFIAIILASSAAAAS